MVLVIVIVVSVWDRKVFDFAIWFCNIMWFFWKKKIFQHCTKNHEDFCVRHLRSNNARSSWSAGRFKWASTNHINPTHKFLDLNECTQMWPKIWSHTTDILYTWITTDLWTAPIQKVPVGSSLNSEGNRSGWDQFFENVSLTSSYSYIAYLNVHYSIRMWEKRKAQNLFEDSRAVGNIKLH